MREQQQRGESADERKGAKRVFAASERGDGRFLDQQKSWRGDLRVIERPQECRSVALDDVPRERDFVDPERRAGQVLPETKRRAERQERAREPSFGSSEEVAGKSETAQPDRAVRPARSRKALRRGSSIGAASPAAAAAPRIQDSGQAGAHEHHRRRLRDDRASDCRRERLKIRVAAADLRIVEIRSSTLQLLCTGGTCPRRSCCRCSVFRCRGGR